MPTKLKKQMIIVIASLLGLLLVLTLLIVILTKCSESLNESEDPGFTAELEFSDEYITDESEFYSDEKYLDLRRSIRYNDGNGTTFVIEPDQYDSCGACTPMLCDMIDTIIAGDADTYNTFFSRLYFETNPEKDDFSMQKLYDITITPYSETKNTDYTEYIYILEYKIRNNNGSFRSDVDSDGILPQYIVITDREGSFLIDNIYTDHDFMKGK